MTAQAKKVSFSIPQDLLVFTEELAKEMNTSRSQVVSQCLREKADQRLREQMEEGYKAMAEERLKAVNSSIHLDIETLPAWE